MAEKLLLKSRAEEIYDFRQVDITPFLKGFVADEAQYRKDLERVLKRFGRKVEADAVSEGDTVTLSCVSELPRYNKRHMPVPVGKGLLNKGLEIAMVGMTAGETRSFEVEGQNVRVTVEKIIHTVLPELTDENVASFGMEGVSTVADLRKYCIGRQVEAFVLEDENPDMASAYVWQETAKHSRVIRDPEEVAAAERKAEKKLAELQSLSEQSSEEAPDGADESEEEAEGSIDPEMIRNMFVSEVDLAAIGQKMMEQDGVCVTRDDYDAYIGKLCEAYPDKTRSEIEEAHTLLDYTMTECSNYLAHAIDVLIASKFKEFFTKE